MMIHLTEMTGKQVHKALIDEKRYKNKIKVLEDKVKLLEEENKELKKQVENWQRQYREWGNK